MSQCVLQFTRPTFRNSLRPSTMQGAVRSIAQLADLNSQKKNEINQMGRWLVQTDKNLNKERKTSSRE